MSPVESVSPDWRLENLWRPMGSTEAVHGSLDDPTLSCVHPVTAELATYWRDLRREGRLPSRSDLDPLQMRAILPHLVMWDVEPTKDDGAHAFRFRLIATESTTAYGLSTGKYLHDVLADAALERHLWVMERVVNEAVPLRNIGRALRKSRTWLVTEAVATPLFEDERVNVILAAVVRWPENDPPEAVRRNWRTADIAD